VDPAGSHYAHNLLKEKYIVESIVNLSKIPPEKTNDFLLQVCPVEIKGATGCPVCAYARIKK